ncbi:hypothetical protein MRB53_022183 [Persea americana]|uniref:Uncharacterized protein n=1 Tax=Persea americana TaxID=3435 RepID=A0ACC2L606_PERAE|nr:hypothetical protein MRB53_022183 [Persea americana]
MRTRFDSRSDRRASAPGNGNGLRDLRLFRFVYGLIQILRGSVPCGASTRRQPGDVVIEMNGGASNSRQQDDVVRESDFGVCTSRLQDNIVMTMDAEAPTSREYNAEASTSRQYNDEDGEREEETPNNADRGREEPETEDDTRERVEWVASIEKKLQDHTRTETAETETISIPIVSKGPRGFGQGVEIAYEPRVIPIGPYHRSKPHLQNMQELEVLQNEIQPCQHFPKED